MDDGFLIGILLGVFVGWLIIKKLMLAMAQVAHNHQQEIAEIIAVKLEEIDGIFYVYDIDKHEFLAQGHTSEEIQVRLRSRFPISHFPRLCVFVVEGETAVIERLNSTIQL